MAILKRTTKKADTATEPKVKKAKAKKTEVSAELADVRVAAPVEKTAKFAYALISPRVSEKAAIMASKGTYVFNIPLNANKIEVRKAVETFYKVNVTDVRTVRGVGKIVRRGRTAGSRNNWKKALVTLKPGQKIDLYEGV